MKNTLTKRFFINVLLFLSIACAMYYLYSPLNRHVNNVTHSAISFVYQQF